MFRRGFALTLTLAACNAPAPTRPPADAPVANVPSAIAATPASSQPTAPATATSLFDFQSTRLDGTPQPLAAYRGHPVLVVNTASECGFTPQYEGLEALYEQYASKGLFILGFPSNDFGGQEPGSAPEIAKFCQKNYGVTFPMFEKVVTKGEGASPIYRFLAANNGEPKWNFHKYLVSKTGQVLRAFPSAVRPDDKDLRAAIDAAL